MTTLATMGTLAWLAPELPEPEMVTSGWIFMGCGWVFVAGLAFWCFKRVLGGGPDA